MNNKCKCQICSFSKEFDIPSELIEDIINRKVVLFCGAGISTESKLVLKTSFYQSIREELGIKEDISFSELMSRYCKKANGRRKLILKLKERFDYIESFPKILHRATKFHKELSHNYLIKNIVTTNWDEYFEKYCDAIPVVSPKDMIFFDTNDRSVLKIHGSINNLSSIIATKEDYLLCKENLINGTIGAKLRSMFVNNTFIFVGFSFGDEDFQYIYDEFIKDLGDLAPHIYVITLDERMNEKFKYDNISIINTEGTYFLHQINLYLEGKKVLIPKRDFEDVYEFYRSLEDIHYSLSEVISSTIFPGIVYTYIYQDGLLDSLERFKAREKSGEYYQPGYVLNCIDEYEKIIAKLNNNSMFFDVAYYEGYLNGLIYLIADSKLRNEMPVYYLPECGFSINSMEEFSSKLLEFNGLNTREVLLAKEYAETLDEGIVPEYYPGF